MKVLIATGLYPPEIGGPATYTALLERELPEYDHSVVVVAFRESRHLPPGIRHVHYAFRLMKRAKGVDLFFAQDVFSVGLPALIVARLMRKIFFVRVPGDYAWEQSTQRFGVTESIDEFQGKRHSWRVRFLQSVQTLVTKYADMIITPSDYFNRLVVGWGVDAKKVKTIYNGVDITIPVYTPVQKPASLVMLSAGRLVSWKGFETLITMMKELPYWHLVILGDGPDHQKLETLIKEAGVKERVHLLGKVSREEVFAWCKAADVFVLNTHFESFSFQIVEAMVAGVPIITTNIGSLPELITAPSEGILLAPDDMAAFAGAIKSVVTDKSAWQNRTAKAEMKAKKFSIDATVQELNALLKKYEA